MEQLMIISLLIIVILLLLDRTQSKDADKTKKKLPSIMGNTNQKERQALSIDANERQDAFTLFTEDNFESETKTEKAENVDQKKDLNEILVQNDYWEEEEKDWKYKDSIIESGFATGVTFQELSTAGQLLQQERLEPDLERQAVNIIQKIQGTELFDLLENSLGDASKRIASLLNSISNDDENILSKQNSSSKGFDIGDFV